MNLVALLKPKPDRKTGSAAFGSSYGGNYSTLGSAHSDMYRKDSFPQPLELIQQLVGIAYGCIKITSEGVASSRLRLYARTGKRDRPLKSWVETRKVSSKTLRYLQRNKATAIYASPDGMIEEVTNHPVLQLLDVNETAAYVDNAEYADDDRPSLSGFQLFKLTQVYLDSIGRAYWLVEIDGQGVPEKVWLLRAHFVKEVYAPDGSGRILYYEYGGPNGALYDPKQIIRFSDPDPYNPYLGGLSPMMAAIEKIRISRRNDANINAILENCARPDAIWSPKGDTEGNSPIGPAEARRMEVAINQKFREAGNGSIMVAPFPGQMQILGWKPGDIVELERAKMLKSEIGFCFGVPDTIINRNDSNLASAETGDYSLAKYGISPRLVGFVSSMRKLLRMYDPTGRLFFAFDDVLPEDKVFQLEQTKAGADIGVVEVGELREAIGLEKFGDDRDNVRYIASTVTTVGADGKPEKSANAPADSKPGQASGNPADGEAKAYIEKKKTIFRNSRPRSLTRSC